MKEVLQKKTAETPKRSPDVRGLNSTLRSDSVPDQVAVLQSSIGNRAVERLFRSGALQAKLRIGQPNDICEQEADRVADQVMRMPDAAVDSRQSVTPLIQRQTEEEEEPVQMKRETGESPSLTSSVESSITSLRGGGKPLSDPERAYFEPRFGTDFSNVRLHEGSRAGGLAEILQAKAFTVGSDIVFGRGDYSPGTAEGERLLAHELTHVVQQKSSRPRNLIQPDRLQGKKGPPTEGGPEIISSDEYKKSSKFRDKGKISVDSSRKIIRSSEVLHARQGPKGREKLPYEYVLLHERRVEIETPSGDKAVLIIKADKYLPFDTLHVNPKMSPKKAVSLPGDFCKLRWSLEGKYGDKFKEALYREYGLSGIEETVQGKALEIFFASGFHMDETLKPKNPRDPCSLKGIAEKNGPAFLRFNLSDRQQYQHIVDYLDGLLSDRLKSEVNLRKKLEEEKKKKRPEKEKRPAPAPAKAVEPAAELAPKDTKGITLPGWLKGILIALGILALAIAAVALVAGIIALGAEILAGAAFVAAFWAAFKIIGTVLLVIGLVRSLVNRFGESKLSGVGDFFRKLGVSLLDTFAIGEMIESFTDRSLITGKPLNLSEEEKWKRRTFGVFGIFAAVFGVRSWLKKSPGKVSGGGPTATAARAPSPAVGELTTALDDLLKVGGSRKITVEGVEFANVRIVRQGRRLVVSRHSTQRVNAPPGHGRVMHAAFEDAVVALARKNGLKTVTIDVGFITNPGWRVYLESIGYVRTMTETAGGGFVNSWVKTIKL